MHSSKLVVVVPCKNEADNIAVTVQQLRRLNPVDIYVAVDPTTKDNSASIVTKMGCKLIVSPKAGYDPAVHAATEAVVAEYVDCQILYTDAGMKYSYDQVEAMRALMDDGADIVLANRIDIKKTMFWHQKLGTQLVISLVNLFCRSTIRDISPLRLVHSSVINRLSMQPKLYRWPSEMIVKALALKLDIRSVEVVSLKRLGSSKVSASVKNSIIAGFQMLSSLQFIRYKEEYNKAYKKASYQFALIAQIIFGLLWLEGASWKILFDGNLAANYDGLAYWVSRGSEYPVIGVYKEIIDTVILPNIKLFLPLVFLAEFTIGLLFVIGQKVRLAALLAIAQTTAITLSVYNAPYEWKWSYFLMYLVSALFFVNPTTATWPRKLFKRK
jgi:uncharacterized membrane protein YphA (DoxX/SURF4 family)